MPSGPQALFSGTAHVRFARTIFVAGHARLSRSTSSRGRPIASRSQKTRMARRNGAEFALRYAGLADCTNQLFGGVEANDADKPVYAEAWAGFPSNPSAKPSLDRLSPRFTDPRYVRHGSGLRDVPSSMPRRSRPTALRARSNNTTVGFLKSICASTKSPSSSIRA